MPVDDGGTTRRECIMYSIPTVEKIVEENLLFDTAVLTWTRFRSITRNIVFLSVRRSHKSTSYHL